MYTEQSEVLGSDVERKCKPAAGGLDELPVHLPDGALVSGVNKPNIHEAVLPGLTHCRHCWGKAEAVGRDTAENVLSSFCGLCGSLDFPPCPSTAPKREPTLRERRPGRVPAQ